MPRRGAARSRLRIVGPVGLPHLQREFAPGDLDPLGPVRAGGRQVPIHVVEERVVIPERRGVHDVGGEDLPDILVMTPEACLMLMSFEPSVFESAGLLVFD